MRHTRYIFGALATILAIGFFLFVWPTPYRYMGEGTRFFVRVNRMTGNVDQLTTDGWYRLAPRAGQATTSLYDQYLRERGAKMDTTH